MARLICLGRTAKLLIAWNHPKNTKILNVIKSHGRLLCTCYGHLSQQDGIFLPKRYLGQPTPFTHKHLLKTNEITPEITRQEYMDRRTDLMSAIGRSFSSASGSEHVVVVLSADKKYMTDDIPYPFRQNTSFLYLTGFQEPDSALVLESILGRNLPEHKATLFVQQRDPERELWDGPRAGTEGALQFLGIHECQPIGDFSEKLHSLASSKSELVAWYDVFKPPHAALHKEVQETFVQQCRNRGHPVNILENVLQSQRVIKSPAEQNLMQTSASVAANAIKDVMEFSQPGINESILYAKLDYSCRIRGAEFLAYPPVIAGGNRANTLHYISNNQEILNNELVLMDAGCEYHGYASDITRTWPVNGRFTDPQAQLYQAILDVQKDCIEMCTVGGTLDQVYHFMLAELGKRLQEMRILPSGLAEWEICKMAKQYCPHHVGHYLGMDTHDTGRISRSSQLQHGMVVTIEPGLYIPELDTSAPAKYRGIGIRIEDDILITDKGPEILSAECPKEIEELEKLIRK
ncbi:probable Xaa-Pro aminopeptidase 3 isoform X1 [Acanthaster planci]|uniref:Probable Xaa-Pro aminopeptidase 3 isoform X1 n=2 Tax=Acanthaster planci TaxID=133434 RepID=A0A8B7ZTE3_ACAPL|nr:probable Xaa-Pro aminopeptidase 3 isoform X1 [Acanthaster planci]